MLEFSFTTAKVNFRVKTRDKYCFISGFSGEGKSLFIAELENYINFGAGELRSNKEVHLVKTRDDLARMDHYIQTEESPVFVADEIVAHKVLRNIKDKKAYAILVTRHLFRDFNFSYRCLFVAKRDTDGVTRIHRKVRLLNKPKVKEFQLIITEDTAAGYEFIRQIVPSVNVVGCGGKDKIYERFRRVSDVDAVLLICDGGGVGTVINKLRKISKQLERNGIKCRILMPECFEHVLLNSGFVEFSNDVLAEFKLSYNNTETFCENKLKELTAGRPFEFDHDKQSLSKCWIIECQECKERCEYYTDKLKKEFVLENGPCVRLLDLGKEV